MLYHEVRKSVRYKLGVRYRNFSGTTFTFIITEAAVKGRISPTLDLSLSLSYVSNCSYFLLSPIYLHVSNTEFKETIMYQDHDNSSSSFIWIVQM